ncbi:hypothetical protein L7F22_042037 [Adiantum nelumboides]|nr:hypothetical protein [Adiantum nelumboides]
MLISLFIAIAILQSLTFASARLSLYGKKLPKDFIYGCGVTAYQVEGAWNEDGKGVSIWDEFVHAKGKKHVKNDATGDIAMDFYHTYSKDIPLFKKSLGINNFDFTISWTRLLPNGKGDTLNEKGVQFYKNVANVAHKNGMSTTCTLYHWDLPAALQHSYGGWKSDKILKDFKHYASLTMQALGKHCDRWASMNEIRTFCVEGYGGGDGESAPGIKDDIPQMFQCAHHALLAHAEAYHEFQKLKKEGKVKDTTFGIKLDGSPAKPSDPSNPADHHAAQVSMAFGIGWDVAPLTTGDYPELMRSTLKKHSKNPNILPHFTKEQSERVKDAYDIIYYDGYSSTFAAALPKGTKCDEDNQDFWPSCIDEETKNAKGKLIGKPTGSDWNFLTNDTLYQGLSYMHKKWKVKALAIGENGMVLRNNEKLSFNQKINDKGRIEWYKSTLHNIQRALNDGIPLKGFIPWTCIRNFEWSNGYEGDFGLVYAKPGKNKKRTPKKSSAFLRKVFHDEQ